MVMEHPANSSFDQTLFPEIHTLVWRCVRKKLISAINCDKIIIQTSEWLSEPNQMTS